MPFLSPIALTIGSAIVAAITVVAAAIGPILVVVGSALAAIAAVIATITITILNAIVVAVTWFASTVVTELISYVNWITIHSKAIYTSVSAYVKSTSLSFKHILEVIHFKTILQVHSIAQIVSPQYRSMMKKVYGAISSASNALGLGPMFLTLAIQNVRNLVLDVSSMFGQKYDLGQVTWLATMNKYLEHFNTNVAKYRNNPEAVFWDLAELIERPSQDAKGALQQVVLANIETVLDFAEKIGTGLGKIGVDIVKLHTDLPDLIKRTIPDPGTVFWNNMSSFLTNHYNPMVADLTGQINEWSADLSDAQSRVSALVDQLRKPGDFVKKIDDLPVYEREDQDRILAEFSNRRLGRLVDKMAPEIALSREKLEANAREAVPPAVELDILSYEPRSGSIPGAGPSAQRGSWFVGEY